MSGSPSVTGGAWIIDGYYRTVGGKASSVMTYCISFPGASADLLTLP